MKPNIHTLLLSLGLMLLTAGTALAQTDLEKELDSSTTSEKVTATFKSPRLINGHSNETIYKHELEFTVDHRFGDIAGKNGGTKNFFGLDNSTDIRIGLDYGISDRFSVSLARLKGATEVTQLYETGAKFRLLSQTTDDKMPISLTLFGNAVISGVKANDDPVSPTAFRGFKDRLSYVSEFIITRKFTSRFSLAIIPTYVHRNFTAYKDQNDLFALGMAARMKITKRMGFVVDYFLPFRNQDQQNYLEKQSGVKFYNPLGVGLEYETGGHIFHLNFTNATAIQETQFIPQTTSSWLKGQFRWGFTISRRFSLGKDKNTKPEKTKS